jgi:TonB family protein
MARITFTKFLALLLFLASAAIATTAGQKSSAQEPDAEKVPRKLIVKTSVELEASANERTEPVYPDVARFAGVSGQVVVHVRINPKGDVVDITMVSGHALLKNAATTAVRNWKFKPAELDGKPVDVSGPLTLKFAASENTFKPGDDDISKAKALVEAFPNSAEAHFWLGSEYSDDDQNKEALNEFNTALELKPNYEEAYRELIDLYRESKAKDDILRTYQRAVEQVPSSLTLLLELARSFNDAKRYTDATDTLKRALESDPINSDVLTLLAWDHMQLKHYEDALHILEDEYKFAPLNTTTLQQIAWNYLQLKRYDDANTTYDKIINLKDVKGVYVSLGTVYRDKGLALYRSNRPFEALDAYNHALEFKDVAGIHCGIASVYMSTGRDEEALPVLQKGLQERPKDGCIYDNLGIVYAKAGRLQEAEPNFRKSLELNPTSIPTYINLTNLMLRQNKRPEALNLLQLGINRVPENTQLRLMLGSLLSLAGENWTEAERQYKEVLRLDPNNANALNDYGYYLVERNERLNEALEMIERAVAANPENGASLDSLGWAYFKLGKLDEAEKYLKKSLEEPTKSPARYEHLGDVYEKQGKRELAVEMWEKALAMKPAAAVAERLKGKLGADTKK